MENSTHGKVYEVPLLNNIGYTYVRLIDPDILLGKGTSSILVQVFNLLEPEPARENLDIKELIDFGYLIDALIMLPFGLELIIARCRWRDIGLLPINDDYQIPNFALCSNKTLGKPERFFMYDWEIVEQLGLMRPYRKSTFEECRGLGVFQHMSIDLIMIYITMRWMKENDQDADFRDEFDFTKPWYKVLANQINYLITS